MDDGSIFMIVALIILIGLSAFFSAAETAYNSLNEIRLRSKAEDGDAKACLLYTSASAFISALFPRSTISLKAETKSL